MEGILNEFEKRCEIDDCEPSLELEEIGDVEVEEKLSGKTGTGHEAAMGDERNAKVHDGGEEIEQKGSQVVKAMTSLTGQLGGMTKSTAQEEDTTRNLAMPDDEQELCLGWGGLWGHLFLNFEPLCGVNEFTFGGTLWLVRYLAMVVDGWFW